VSLYTYNMAAEAIDAGVPDGNDMYAPTLDYFGNPRSALPAVGFAEVED